MALCLAMLCGCSTQDEPKDSNAVNTPNAAASEPVSTPDGGSEASEPAETAPAAPVGDTGPTGLDFSSEVTALEGEWKLSQVLADGNTTDAVADAMSLKITLELDPSELVDDANYIHNQVYNLTGYLTFGVQEIVDELAAEDVEEYKGSTGWQDFPQGEVVSEGEFYKQPGPATMRFKDMDEYGLYLDQVAGVSADVDTAQKTLILGMNSSGQLLLGYSEEHLERPGTDGEWVYCLIFDKA